MQKAVAVLPTKEKVKKVVVRPPEANMQVKFYRTLVRELRTKNQIKKTNLSDTCISHVLVINRLVWQNLEKLYFLDEKQFMKHYQDGEPFELLTNSIQLTTRCFYSYLFIENALDSSHPYFQSCRNLWYKSIRPFLMKIGYISKIKNFRAGNYCSEYEGGRGNFKLVINVKDFLFGIDFELKNVIGQAASDDDNFFCPESPLEIFHPYSQNSFQSEIEIKNKAESNESGEASPQSSCANKESKTLNALAKQVDTPPNIQKKIGENSAEFGPESINSVSDSSIIYFASKLSKLFIKSICKKEFLNSNQVRIRRDNPIDSLTIRDYTHDFVKLIKHCRQTDELDFNPAFERLRKIIKEKPDWLRKDSSRWIYTPDQYLSTEKYNGTDDFVMKAGSLRAYHDEYTIHTRERITPSVSTELEDILDSFYPTLKGFGISDKFLNEWIEKLGKENFVNELRRCFARLAQGFKPLSKAEYIRRAIRNCYLGLVKEKADLQVKKAQIAQNTTTEKPFKPSENQIKDWLKKELGEDATLFGSMQLYALRTNAISPDSLKTEAHRLLRNIKLAQAEEKTIEMLLDTYPTVADDIKQAYRFKKNISLKDFTKEYLKQKFQQYFINL